MEGQRRKSETLGGLGRAFSKLRATLRRRGTSRENVPVLAATLAAKESTQPTKQDEQAVASRVVGKDDGTEDVNAPAAAVSEGRDSSKLEAEGPIDVDDQDQTVQPMGIERGTVDDQKIRELFGKYGVQYAPRRHQAETSSSPANGRRVEKPVRMRVHWKCHQCHGSFSREKTCLGCSHQRCEDCIRVPPRKLREAVVRTPQEQSHSSHAAPAIIAAPVLDLPAPNKNSAVEKSTPGLTGLAADLLAADQTETEDEADLKYSIGSFWVRPRNSEMLVVQPKKQIMRRQCHQCETPFSSPSRTKCENCQHTRCRLCPRLPTKAEKWSQRSQGDEYTPFEEAPMVRAVQRVYKQPRQRVRWTCDHCQTILIDRRTCAQCGHDRCETCTRYPPKKEKVHDPDIVQAVLDRLAAYHFASEPPQAAGLLAAT